MAVTTVEYGGELPQEPGISTAATAPRATASATRLFASSTWAYRAAAAERLARYQRLAAPLASSLDQALANFSKALRSFQWPSGGALATARVAVTGAGLANAATAAVTVQATPQEKLLSVARAASASTPLADADADTEYALALTQGGESRTLAVTVPAGSDWEGVLAATAQAINATDLPVQASVVRQSFAGQKLEGVNKLGTFLAVTVNPAQADQDITLADTAGHLANGLRLAATRTAATPATAARYDLRIDRLASAAGASTGVKDPGAASGLAAGDYSLAYATGGRSGTITVGIDSDMTWGEVLDRAADAINSSTGLLRAEVADQPRVSGLDRSDAYWAEGAYLAVSLAAPKLGQRLSLSEDGGSWLGLQPTATPGSDAVVQVGGRTLASESGVFSLDQGRVNLAVQATTGEAQALYVREAAGEITARLADIVHAYNGLSTQMARNADLLDQKFQDRFRDPVADLVPRTAELGLARLPDSTLAFSPTALAQSLAGDPASAQALLLDPDSGLLTRWSAAADAALDAGAATALAPPTLLADLGPSSADELRLERSGRLLDVLETTASLSSLAAAKQSGLAATLPPEGLARLVSRRG